MPETGPLSEIMNRLRSLSESERVSFGDMLENLGNRSILPLILIPALIAATPLSGIPGVSMACGLLIAILSAELLLRFRKARLPHKLTKRTVDGERLRSALDKAAPYVNWIERHTRNRMTFLFHRPMIWIPQILCVLTGALMPFLEFIPFSSSLCAIAVCFLVMALLTEDGLFFVLALLPYAGGAYLITQVLQ